MCVGGGGTDREDCWDGGLFKICELRGGASEKRGSCCHQQIVSWKEQWGGVSLLSAGHSDMQSSENVTQRSLRWRASTVTRQASAAAAAALPQRNN